MCVHCDLFILRNMLFAQTILFYYQFWSVCQDQRRFFQVFRSFPCGVWTWLWETWRFLSEFLWYWIWHQWSWKTTDSVEGKTKTFKGWKDEIFAYDNWLHGTEGFPGFDRIDCFISCSFYILTALTLSRNIATESSLHQAWEWINWHKKKGFLKFGNSSQIMH